MFDNIPNVGYLILNTEGAILKSGGELENDEKNANIIHDLITLTERYEIFRNFVIKLYLIFTFIFQH